VCHYMRGAHTFLPIVTSHCNAQPGSLMYEPCKQTTFVPDKCGGLLAGRSNDRTKHMVIPSSPSKSQKGSQDQGQGSMHFAVLVRLPRNG
jgi:hypothetical protein